MSRVFADTFYWLALLNVRDGSHEKARRLSKEVRGRVTTSQAVLIEVMDALCNPPHRGPVHRFWRAVHDDPGVVVVRFDEALLEQAAAMFLTRGDKGWSMTDCISFAIMTNRGIGEALTMDHHFQQAGFRILF